MKTCYVSMPFGRKTDSSGTEIDFDLVYQELIKPAAESAGLACMRADELRFGAFIHKAVFSAVLGSDVMIADITTLNANVFYELGLRHATRRGMTILVMAQGSSAPFNISYSQIVRYNPVDLREEHWLREKLAERIKGVQIEVDSPLFEFFPDLRVQLPSELVTPESRRRIYPEHISTRLATAEKLTSRDERVAAVVGAESAAKQTPELDPTVYLNLLKAYRDDSAWNEMIRMVDSLAPEIAKDPAIVQLLALALNRRAQSGDQDRAIAAMKESVAATGGDAESFGILGRIYKDRYATNKDFADLHAAIGYYKKGFELQPTDFYTGLNAVTLLAQSPEPSSRDELENMLPNVRRSVEARITPDAPPGYWELSAALQWHVWHEIGRQLAT
jgi:hypothetical protein